MTDTPLLYALLALALVAAVALVLRHRAQRDARRRAALAAEEAARTAREQARLLEAARLESERAAAAQALARRQQAEQQERERHAAQAARQEAERAAAAQALAERERAAAAERTAAAAAAQAAAEAAQQAAAAAALAEAARAAAGAEAARAAAAAAARPRTAAETLVMVADDSKVVRVKTSRLLTQHGYRVVLAEDGLEAVRLIDTEAPHVLVTDVEMPGLDGFALTRHVRGQAGTAHIPIIMITSADDRLKAAAAEAGVTLVLGKPYPEEELLACIQRAAALAPAPETAAA